MYHRRIIVAVAVAGVGPPAVAHAQPTLQFDRPCYAEQQDIRFTGTGYTPGGPVDVVFALTSAPLGAFTIAADAAGAFDDLTGIPSADHVLPWQSDRETILATANDRTRIETGQQPPESQFAAASFTFTRWQGFSPRRYVRGRRATVEIYGWAFAAGKPAWLLFRKRSRTVASVKLGRLDDACGDRTATIRVPRGLTPGRYRVVLTPDRRLRDRFTWLDARVTARRSAGSAVTTGRIPMNEGGPDV